AKHVQPEYRLANGEQLASVVPKIAAVPQQDQLIPITAVVIHTGYPLDSPRDLDFGLVSRGAMYLQVGGAQGGTLPGTASLARGRLVRREALELALYTFEYAPSVDTVITWVPPVASASGQAIR